MASTTETGHANNVASFEKLITNCTALGTAYNPAKASLQLTALNAMLLNAHNALQAVTVAQTNYKTATNAREAAFKPLKKLATRIIAALAATDSPQGTIDDAKSINMKIQGKRATTAKKASAGSDVALAEAPKTISASHQGYDKLIEFYAELLQLLSTEPKYAPNEAELKVASLTTLLADLKAKNTAAIAALTNVTNTRIARDQMFYDKTNGLVHIAGEVKDYVKSVFGAESAQFKQVSKMTFRSKVAK